MKRVNNLFDKIISNDNLLKAITTVNKTHRWFRNHKPNKCTVWVEKTKDERVEELKRIIIEGFKPKKPRVTKRWDVNARKTRIVNEPAQWPDQYIHHALVQVLQPIMMRGMDRYCCGSIQGRGTHYAKRTIEKHINRDYKGTKYGFCGDIYHFYDTLKPQIIMDKMKRLIKDYRVLDLIWHIVKDGILIGLYTSQWFANTILQPLDRAIRDSKLCKYYVRYMDNLTIFGANKRKLRKLKELIKDWLNKHGLQLKSDWQIFATPQKVSKVPLEKPRCGFERTKRRMPDAVGYRYGRGYTLLRKRNLLRIKRAVAKFRKRKRNNKRITIKMASSLLSRLGQLKHCNNYNVYKILFKNEPIISELKAIIKNAHRGKFLEWNILLEQRTMIKSLK